MATSGQVGPGASDEGLADAAPRAPPRGARERVERESVCAGRYVDCSCITLSDAQASLLPTLRVGLMLGST